MDHVAIFTRDYLRAALINPTHPAALRLAARGWDPAHIYAVKGSGVLFLPKERLYITSTDPRRALYFCPAPLIEDPETIKATTAHRETIARFDGFEPSDLSSYARSAQFEVP